MKIQRRKPVKASNEGSDLFYVVCKGNADDLYELKDYVLSLGNSIKDKISDGELWIHTDNYQLPDIREAAKSVGVTMTKNVTSSHKPASRKRAIKASNDSDDIVMYLDGKKVYEGDIRDIDSAIAELCKDEDNNQIFMEYLNQFGDPFDFDGTPEDTARTFAWWVAQDFDEAEFAGEDFYVQDTINGKSIELFLKSDEAVEGSVQRRAKKSVKASNKPTPRKRAIKASISDFRNMDFDEQIEWLNERVDGIWSDDSLNDYLVNLIQSYDYGTALHILDALYNDPTDATWYKYDASMGTMSTPEPLADSSDLEDIYIEMFGEDDE